MKASVLLTMTLLVAVNAPYVETINSESRISMQDTPFVKIPHKKFDIPCSACHTTDSWKILKPKIDYDHKKTGFPLIGAHTQISCAQCHSGGKFSHAIRECNNCHKDPHQSQLGIDCERCHHELTWSPSIFKHDDQNLFMFGAHKGVDCASCHKNLTTFKMPNIQECGDCHFPIGATTNHNGYKVFGDCMSCHNMNGWSNYPHLDEWFSLTGHHRRNCETCHKQTPIYTTYTCRNCHRFDHKGEGGDDD